MQQLATIIREQIDTLVDQYDVRLRIMPGYSNLPEAMRREMERRFLNLIAESLDAGDYSLLVQYAQQRASQWDARGLNLAWFQQALIVPEELLVPLVQSVETSNFVWQALNRSQGVIWQMVAERTHQTEERFRSIVETAHSGIMIIDDQFHFIYVNEQLTRISGYSQAELIGADFRQLLDEDSRRLVADRYVRRQRGEDVAADYEITFIHKDGQKRYVEMSAVLLRDASGRQQTVAQVLDVSERKQSEQALRDNQQLLQSVMDNIPQAVFWKDRQLRYLGCNQAFAEDTGLNLPQIIVGRTDYDMPWQTQAELYRADDQHVMDSGAAKINYEEQQTTPSGEITWLRTSKIPMHDADGNVIAVLGMYEDITERKQFEQRIRKSLELREQQVRSGTEVSQEIAAAPDLNELFKRVVTLIKERFNYYHAQIFRYDSVLDAVVLVTGYGQVGQHMLSDGHQLPMGRGVVGTAAATGRSILASDVRQDEDWRPNPHLPETKGELAVPIKLRDQVLGILDVQSDQAGALTDDDRLLLEGLCGQIAVAMESTRLLDRTETLYRISAQLSAAQTYDEVLNVLRQHTLLQQADLNISVNLYDRPWVGDDMPDWSTTLVRWSMLPASAVSPRYPLKAFSAAATLLRPDEPTIVSDVQNDPRLDAATRELYGKRFGAGSTIFLPLVTAGKWIGYVNAVFSQPRSFEEEAVRLLTTALKQASTVIESLRRLNDLATSGAQLSEALRIAHLANWEYDVASDTFTFNDQFYALMRTTAEREGGYTMSSAQYSQRFVHPDDAALVGTEIGKALATTDPDYRGQIDHRIYYADGEPGYITVRYYIEQDAQGRTIKTYGANQDITERKLVETALSEERNRLRTLIDNLPVSVFIKDRDSRFMVNNAVHLRILGAESQEEVSGKWDFDYFPQELAAQYYADEQELMRIGQPLFNREEFVVDQSSGKRQWALSTKIPLRDSHDQVAGFLGFTQDITERKLAEQALQRNEAELSEALRIAQMGNWSYDVPTDTFTFNDQFYALMRTTAEREGGYTMSSAQYTQRFVHPDDAPLVGMEIGKALETTDPHYRGQVDHRIYYADGELGYITVRFYIEKDAQGHTVKTHGANQDITERKRTEEVIRVNEAQLSEALKTARLAYWELDLPRQKFIFNDQLYALLHTSAEAEGGYEMDINAYVGRFIYPEDIPYVGATIAQELQNPDPNVSTQLEARVICADGEVRWLATQVSTKMNEAGQAFKAVGTNQDITERKLAEEAIRRSETQLAEALKTAKLAYWSYDAPTDTFTFNDQFYAVMRTTIAREGGYTMSSAQYAQRFVYPEDAAMVGTEIGKALGTTDPDYRVQVDHRVYFGDGELGYVTVRFSIEKDEQGRTVRMRGANQDITDRKTAEAELQRSERLMRTLIDAMPDHIYAKDLDGRLILANLAEARLRGVETPDVLIGKSDFDFYPRELAEQYLASEQLILRDGTPLLNHEEPSLDAAGHSFWSSTTKVPLRNNQGQIIGLVGRTTDITERKLAEAEREQILTDQQRRAVQLQTAAEVGRSATSILNPDQLLDEIVQLVAARFGFYHVAAFTVDESGRWAQLRAATGEVGQQLLDRGQALGIHGKSLVGNAIRHRQPRIALDVGAEAVQFNDPLLPATRSEIALPLFVGDRALGALDAQSTLPAAFDENFAILLQSMADQIAVALNTAEKYQREQAHVEQTNRLIQIVIDLSERTDRAGLQNRLVRSALSLLDTDRAQFWLKGASGLELKAAQSVRPGADQRLAISQELADRVYRTGLPLRLDSPPVQAGYASRITDVPFNAALITPISWQGHTTGVLSVMRSQPGHPFTQDDENSAQLLAAQAAAALANITLAEQQQHRTMQLQTAAEVSQATSSILNLDALLPQAAEVVRARFNLYYVGIFLNDEADRWAVLRAGTGDAGQQMLANGHKLKIGETSMISQCIAKQQARIALDVGEEAVRFDNPQLPLTRSELALPLINRGRVIGAVTIQSDQPAAFTADDITVLQTMADQIGNAVENARLYEQSNAALQEVDALNRRLTGEAWESYLHQRAGQHVISVTDDSQTAPDLLPQLDGLLAAGEIVVEPAEDDRSEATVTAPILLRGQAIGALRMRTPLDAWDKDTEAILTGIAGHIAQAVENARLMEQTQRTASRERAINEINARVRQTIDLDAILRTAVNELGQSLKAARVTARINVADSDQSSRRFADMEDQPQPDVVVGSPRGNDHD